VERRDERAETDEAQQRVAQSTESGPPRTLHAGLLALQRSAGNRAVAGVIAALQAEDAARADTSRVPGRSRGVVTRPPEILARSPRLPARSPRVPARSPRVLARSPRVLARSPDPHADLAVALAANDWGDAAIALSRMNQPDALTELGAMSTDQLNQIDAAAPGALTDKKAHTLHRRISFTQHDPGPADPHADQVTVNRRGTLGSYDQVPGGRVAVRTDVDFSIGATELDEGFSLKYAGTQSADTHWLQFIWREIIVKNPDEDPFPLDDTVTTTGGTYNLTIDHDDMQFNTDSADATTPFYEGAFVNNRTDEATTIFDQPAPITAKITPLFQGADAAESVTSKAHFTTYLVRGMDVLYKAKIDVSWLFTDANVPHRHQHVRGAWTTNRLETGHRDRLIEQYPNFDYLP